MNRLIYQNENYSISLSDSTVIPEVARFIVEENTLHHEKDGGSVLCHQAIECIQNEEFSYKDSLIYVARNNAGRMIGSIRVFLWDKKVILPMQHIFGIDPTEINGVDSSINFWHVGRFAITRDIGIGSLFLFKQLMVLAIEPIVKDPKESCMLAETDGRLLKVMNLLGMGTRQVGDGMEYLSSQTIPMISMKSDLNFYFNKYSSLIRSE